MIAALDLDFLFENPATIRSDSVSDDLIMPPDFPVVPFKKIQVGLRKKVDTTGVVYQEYSGAWNAVSYRFLAATQYSDDFTDSITKYGSSVNREERYRQEKNLFGFFTNGLSTLEAAFYGLFATGAFLNPSTFPMMTAKEHKYVSPERTHKAYSKAFPGEPILALFDQTFSDDGYVQLKDIRNVLAHRTAPGRTFYVSLDSSEPLPAEWKLFGLSIDHELTVTRRRDLARLLSTILVGTQAFIEAKFP